MDGVLKKSKCFFDIFNTFGIIVDEKNTTKIDEIRVLVIL